MRYYVNEDKGDNAATIHDVESPTARASCYPQDKKPQNGRWWGPFLSKTDAWKCAENTGRKTYGECENCLSGTKKQGW